MDNGSVTQQYILAGHENWVNDILVFEHHPSSLINGRDCESIISVSNDLRFWNVSSDNNGCELDLYQSENPFLSKNRIRVRKPPASGHWLEYDLSDSKAMRVFPATMIRVLPLPVIRLCKISENPGMFFAASCEGVVKLFDMERELWTLKEPRGVWSIENHCDWFATGSSDGTLSIWDLRQNHDKPVLTRNEHKGVLRDIQILNSGLIYTASSDSTIKLWDLRHLQSIKTIRRHLDSVLTLACSEKQDHMFSGGRDGLVYDFDSSTTSIAATHVGEVTSIQVAQDNKLWTATNHGLITQWVKQPSRLSSVPLTNYYRSDCRSNTKQPPFVLRKPQSLVYIRLTYNPEWSILPALRVDEARLMSDQQKVLLLTSDDCVCLRDIVTSETTGQWPNDVSIQQAEETLEHKSDSIPVDPWMKLDISLGYLRISLNEKSFRGGVVEQQFLIRSTETENQKILLAQVFMLKLMGPSPEKLSMDRIPRLLAYILLSTERRRHNTMWINVKLGSYTFSSPTDCLLEQVPLPEPFAESINPTQVMSLPKNELKLPIELSPGCLSLPILTPRIVRVDRFQTIEAVTNSLWNKIRDDVKFQYDVNKKGVDILVLYAPGGTKVNPAKTVGAVLLNYYKIWPPSKQTQLLLLKYDLIDPPPPIRRRERWWNLIIKGMR